MKESSLRIPWNYSPREYQVPFWQAMDNGKRRAVLVWHRRSGKDKTVWNFTIREAFSRVGNYYYFFPTYNQGRKVLWDGKDRDGFPFLSHIPAALRQGDPNQTEMKIQLKNGSLVQVVGSDNIDTIVGTNPIGCVFSEYSLQDPRGWDFIRPILRENGGWAVFVYTPRGKNHGFDLAEMARGNDEWFFDRLTIEDTFEHGGTVGPAEVQAEREAGMRENLILQEYYCSFEAAVENAVFETELLTMRKEGRVTRVPYVAGIPVDTYWDLGHYDATSILFVQRVRSEVRVIDFYDGRRAALDHYVKVMREKPYVYGTAYMPHDAQTAHMATGKSTVEVAWEFGLETVVVPKHSKQQQIDAARMIFNRLWIDETKGAKLIDSIGSYYYEYDDEKKILSRTPAHNWASHACDALEILAVAHVDGDELKAPDRYARKTRRHTSWMAA